ncbi:SDR family NAD(P)-dependent oxidoreductase [Pendulispora brunnea]|uniref:SDR family NAD(P)-dependent oxidoreductase n=1 Tax=Pendulispora brunnea TaxID=2905690 RepID=A0ABZ2KNF4_9BACT
MNEKSNTSLMKRALAALKDAETEISRYRNAVPEPIAIVGAGCRIPGGATSPPAFWRLLEDGFDALREMPPGRRRLFESLGANPPAAGGLLDGIDRFDPSFFSISPREAISLDPAQRLLLEVSVEALEDGGIPLRHLRGSRTGTFMGFAGYSGYGSLSVAQVEMLYAVTGLSVSIAAGRIAYALDLQGPCIALDTACSSSLVAVHLASQSLRSGECNVALAGGVNVIAVTVGSDAMQATGALSSQGGRCRTFDAGADGYVRSEGCGVVVLKRLSDAQKAGDRVLGVIAGSAVSHDGHSNGLTAPNGRAQERLLRDALSAARMRPEDIDYVESHGTGTPLGDPIELEALGQVFARSHDAGRPLMVGSVKTNIGHTEGAAGIVGLLKVLGMFRRGIIPRHLHFEVPSPRVAWDALPISVPRETLPWPRTEGKRRVAGVNAFGFNGTISHAIVTEPPAPTEPSMEGDIEADRPRILPISAKTDSALQSYIASYIEYLDSPVSLDVTERDIAYTASERRDHHEHRLVVLGHDRAEWCDKLRSHLAGERPRGLVRGTAKDARPRVAFVFCGQGPQWAGMGRELVETEPVFRAAWEACYEHIRAAGGPAPSDDRMNQTAVAQPALFALQVSLAALWRSWGVSPDAVVGHSIGEVAAAHVAGALTLEDAARLVVLRGQIMQKATGLGKMLSVALPSASAERLIAEYGPRVSIGASNSPNATVLSGEAAALQTLAAQLGVRGIEAKWLPVEYAFHSAQMEGFGEELRGRLRELSPNETKTVLLMSTARGQAEQGTFFDADYWGQQILKPVLFAACIRDLVQRGYEAFLEMGPHPVLAAAMNETWGAQKKSARALASLRRNEEERPTMLESLGALHCAGYPIDWSKAYPTRGRTISLPTYPWQRQSYWLEGGRPKASSREEHCALEWRASPLVEEPGDGGGGWLIFADSAGRGAALEAHLASQGAICVRVTAGEAYARRGARDYVIDPREPAHFVRLLAEDDVRAALASSSGRSRVVHLWSANAAAAEPSLARIQQAQTLGSISALHLVQALAGTGWAQLPRLWLLTEGAQSVENEAVSVEQAPLWGFGMAVVQEMPELDCRLLDLDAATDIGCLADELLAGGDENRIVLRGAERYVARLVFYVPENPAPSFKSDATYLVTGGLGGLGLEVVKWMAARGARHFALLGRRAPPSDVEQVLEGVRAEGASVATFSVDVADAERLRAVVDEIRTSMPPLSGIIHAAGVPDMTPLAELDAPRLEAIGRAKLDGGWNLHEVSRGLSLDFFVLFSSVASLFGSPGQASYAAANAFLDGLAHYRRARALPALSIHFTAWSDVGMATQVAAHTTRYLATQGMGVLTAAEGIAALEHVFVSPRACVGIVPLSRAKLPKNRFVSELVAPTQAVIRAYSRIANLPREKRFAAIEDTLRGLLAKATRMPKHTLKTTDVLHDLGLDSLIALEVRQSVEEELNVQLVPSDIAAQATVHDLSARVAAKFDALHAGVKDARKAELSDVPAPLTILKSGGPAPRLRLVCFTGRGGCATDFQEWVPVLPEDWELVAVEYPSWDSERFDSNASGHRPLASLTLQVAGALMALPKAPFACLGHSLGALIAYATVVELERHAIEPMCVVLSNPTNSSTIQRTTTREQFRDERFLMTIADLEGVPVHRKTPEARRRFLNAFGEQCAWNFDFDPKWKLSCPIVMATSRGDGKLQDESLDVWRRSGGALTEWTFAGGHDYIRLEFAELASRIVDFIEGISK